MAVFVSTDENDKVSPDNLATGMAADTGVAGAAASPVAALSPKPPYTNRGAEITIPPENRSLLDWVSFTVKAPDPQEALALIDLDPTLFSESKSGFSGYRKSLRFGNIIVFYDGREDMGCHVEMTGQGCRQFEAQFSENPWPSLFATALAAQANFTRLDIAIDNVDGALSLSLLSHALQDHDRQTRTLFGEWRQIRKGSFANGEGINGETIYLGSSKSHTMFRVYNKAQESDIDGKWIRFEIQLRSKRAHEAAKLIAANIQVGTLATGIINNYFAVIHEDDSNKSRCTLQPWWSEWLQTTDKIRLTTEKATKLVTDSMEFIKRQYAPSLAMINKHLGSASFNEYFKEVIEDGKQRMGAKHERILAASAQIGGNR
ncbi:MAG: hypothetical protein CXR31_05885 [Geobacter sp.]|nr:MAG: hypothetical protein CXR31_05885 [Geobacter sp.]